MIKIDIQGMSEGKQEISLSFPVDKIDSIAEEFFGIVHINGELRKISNRYTLKLRISGRANLVCDLSLKEYIEDISTDLQLSFIADSNLYDLKHENDLNEDSDDDEILIREETKYLDITDRVIEELLVSLPMKRIAPENRNKELKDIYPEYTADNESEEEQSNTEIDERWKKLKNIKIN